MGPSPDLNLDEVSDSHLAESLSHFGELDQSLVTVQCSLSHWSRLAPAMCAMRAAGLSAVLQIHRQGEPLTREALQFALTQLKDWDQLLVLNILELLGDRIPSQFLAPLQQEAKIELKWFREWQQALADKRVTRYPNLPWRSFIRKINAENFAFSIELLDLTDSTAPEGSAQACVQRIRAFLEQKKQVVCLFPKKWGGQA